MKIEQSYNMFLEMINIVTSSLNRESLLTHIVAKCDT